MALLAMVLLLMVPIRNQSRGGRNVTNAVPFYISFLMWDLGHGMESDGMPPIHMSRIPGYISLSISVFMYISIALCVCLQNDGFYDEMESFGHSEWKKKK